MNKYAIYTQGNTFPVLEKDGNYYIASTGTGHFSGQWKFLGVKERLKGVKNIIKPEEALKITDWKFKNGTPRYQVVDLDHGTIRIWAGTSADQQLSSFGNISDNMFDVITGIKSDKEITLEESKKYNIYATYGGDGVYNSKLVDTVDSEEQAVDRVAELQATGVGASYEEVENDKKEESKHSKIADKIYDKYSEFIQRIYTENKDFNTFINNLKDDEGFIEYLNDYFNIISEKDIDLVCRELYDIQIDIMNSLEEEVETSKKEESKHSKIADKIYDKYSEFIQGVYADNKNLNEFVSNMCEDEGFLDYLNDYYDITSEKDIDLICRELYNIQVDIMNSLNEECSQASGVASGINGKIDSFPINPKEMEKQRLKESIDNPYFVIEDNGSCYLLAGPFNNEQEARKVKNSLIKKYNLEDEADIIYVWNWNKIKEYTYNAYDTYKEFIDGCDRAPYYKEEKLEESIDNPLSSEDKNIILNFINQCINSGKFNKEQINEIKYGFEDGLTLEQLKVYANPKFDNYQMYEIRWGFKDGLTLEQVRSYADSKISDSEMWNIREKLEGNYEKEDDSLFEALKELINYLNKNTKYNWDANEMYDNCAITESDTDYIEVFVDIKDGNKIYTVDNYSYNSLEELVKNMPVLFTDEDEDYDYDSNWEDLDESKDLTKTLQEMALLEDYEEESEISPQKQKFIDYCKDKIEDLGDIEIYDEDYEENIPYHKLMHTEGIREFDDLYIIANFDDYENENLIAINNENKIVINTPMIDCNGYAATMQFDKIDKQFYDQLMDFWDDLYMDEMIEEE